jgi:3-oxoadipate enol-lactonase
VIEIRVYPQDCDQRGQLSHTAFVAMLERARWDALASGPGENVFSRNNVWPALRKAAIEHYDEVRVGEVLQFESTLTHLARTSFSLHQTVRRPAEHAVVAEGDFVFVCMDDAAKPAPVPEEIRRYFGTRPSVRAGAFQHFTVRGNATAVDVQGDGAAVLFIHGFPLDRTMWRHLIAPLTGWRRIAPDLRGMGMSDVPSDDRYGIDVYADDMVALLDLLQVEKAVICGLSMGGYVALEMMRRAPERIRGLILANSQAEPDSPEAKQGRDEQIRLVERGGPAVLVDRLLPKLLAPTSLETLPGAVEHVKTMITGSPAAGVVGALRAMRDRPDSRDLLPKITVPTLVIAGRDDQLIPLDHSRAMADVIPEAHFTTIPGAGHLAPLEQPIATSRVIAEFLQSLS